MKNRLQRVLLLLLLAGLITGCGADTDPSNSQEQETTGTLVNEESEQTKAPVIQGNDVEKDDVKTLEVSDASNISNTSDSSNGSKEGITYSYKEMSLTFPASWENRYVIKENDDGNGFSVLQKASYEKHPGLGFLFGVYSSDTPFLDAPESCVLAYTEDKIYFYVTPTDVPYDCEDEAVARDYELLLEDMELVKASIVIDAPQIHTNASEYVFPMSEYYPLQEDMLWNMGENELWLARNEIYARHGYHFKNGYLQAYFEKYAWYEDRGDSFSEDELSQIEKDNVKLFKKMETAKVSESPYPLEEKVGKRVSVDLSGNGKENTILYQITEDANGFEKPSLTVDDITYDLEEEFQIYMDWPEEEHFYITDISPYFDGLEIAIADYGPSDDPVTHFFVYDEARGLEKIGSVSGFPMKQMGFQNGFITGGVIGYNRCMTLDVHEYLEYYWYDYENRRLELQVGADGHIDLPRSHRLLTDLPLHYAMDQASDTFVIPEGSKVFIKRCFGKNWVLVHGPNGAEGYLHYDKNREDAIFPYLDELETDADCVFEGLLVYD